MTGCGFHLTADDILQLHLTLLYIKTIHIDMIHSLIRYQQIFVVMRHTSTVDVGAEIALCHTAQSFMVDLVGDLSDGTILLQTEYGQLTVMITCHKQILICVIRRYITSSHTVDRCKVDQFQISVRHDRICLYTKIRYRIKKLSVMRNGQVRRVGDLYFIFFLKTTVFHIHIIYSDTVTVPLCITGNIGNIFSLAHDRILLSILYLFMFINIAQF